MSSLQNWKPEPDSTLRPAPGLLTQIRGAQDQFEAARLRQERLVQRGELTWSAFNGTEPNRIPGYVLERELHRGGQGVVYLAVQLSTGRQVAIKILNFAPNSSGAAAGLARFQREIEILSRLKHANVVTIHDCGRTDDIVYLVMDYVAGSPLDGYAARARPGIHGLLALFARICDGVNAAHLRGIIHRDLKPGNILVDEQGEPRVLDFGLAKLVDDSNDAWPICEMTEAGQFVGSLPWASPEQAEGRADALDIRSDVYSLGVVLYQLLTGRFPYPVLGRLDDVVRHIVHTLPARPSNVARNIDREIETILLKCLAKEPERRYQNAGELARDIRRYLSNEPIEARRDSVAYVMAKQLARFRAAALAASAIMIALLLALIVSVAFWREAVEQRTIAQQSAASARLAAERADREADQTRVVVDFMRDVLTSVQPENQGADVKLIQVVQNATQAVPQRFAGHPQQEAQVRELLGQVYFNFSMWREAQVEYDAALELWRKCAGPDDPRTLQAESTCAGVALNLSRYHEVEAALDALLPRMIRVLGPDHRATLAARRSLAIAHLYQGRVEEAEATLRELRRHPLLANDDALQLRLALSLIEVLQWQRAKLPDSPERDAILAQEDQLAHEWIERSTRLNGPANGSTLQARSILAQITNDRGDFQAAAAEARAVLSDSEGRLPECHDVRAYATMVLATSLGELGYIQEPAQLYLQRIECMRGYGPPARVALISAITDALPYLERAGRAVDGEALARELSEATRRFGGSMALTADLHVARFVSMQNRLDEAAALFDALLARDAPELDPRLRARLRLYHGRHLVQRGCFADAERELERAAGLLADVPSAPHDGYPDDLILAYVDLYETSGRLADAAALALLYERR